jgi:hypothetical protein
VFDARTKPWYRPEFIHPSEFADWPRPSAADVVA